MDAILMSANPERVDIQEAIDFLSKQDRLFWEVPFNINKSQFKFPIKCYIHISGTDIAEFVAIVNDIIPHNPSHYTGEDAKEHKPESWIRGFIDNPPSRGYFKSVLIMSEILKINPLYKNSMIRKNKEEISNWPQLYTNILDPLDSSKNTDLVACNVYETEEKEVVLRKVLRDTVLVQELKMIYNNSCQVCNKQIDLGDCMYSEAHHLQPLGKKKHNGPDIKENIIILCPNHHAEFDFGAIGINPDMMVIEHVNPHDPLIGSKITMKHNIDKQYLLYHYEKIFKR